MQTPPPFQHSSLELAQGHPGSRTALGAALCACRIPALGLIRTGTDDRVLWREKGWSKITGKCWPGQVSVVAASRKLYFALFVAAAALLPWLTCEDPWLGHFLPNLTLAISLETAKLAHSLDILEHLLKQGSLTQFAAGPGSWRILVGQSLCSTSLLESAHPGWSAQACQKEALFKIIFYYYF